MTGRNLLTVAIASIVLLAASVRTLRADEKEVVFGLGKAIVKAAHFTGVKHKLRDYSSRGNRLTIEMDWRGGVLDTPYTSTIKIEFRNEGGKVKVVSIDYKDDALVAYNRNSIERWIRTFNED